MIKAKPNRKKKQKENKTEKEKKRKNKKKWLTKIREQTKDLKNENNQGVK